MKTLRKLERWSESNGLLRLSKTFQCAAIFIAMAFTLSACGYAGAPPNPNITVGILPVTANVALGQTQQFQSSVTGSSDAAVTWEVNGVTGGNANSGTVSSAGMYAAPVVLPSPAIVTVTAVSQANPKNSASANVTLQDGISISVSPGIATVESGGAQVFTASLSGTGTLAAGVTWSVNAAPGGNPTVGTIAPNSPVTAVYTAPSTVPSPATVTVTATSLADSAKSGSATVTITCANPNAITPSIVSVALGQLQTFSASFCAASAAPISWDVNGIPSGNSTIGTITVTGAASAAYTAPADIPTKNPVLIHATSGGSIVTATITILSTIVVSVSPPASNVLTAQRLTLTPNVTNTSDASVTWKVNGSPNGDISVGQICQLASNPCLAPVSPSSVSIDYLAPSIVPTTNPVTVTATSAADPSKNGAATISITSSGPSVGLTLSPLYAFVPASGCAPATQQFFAIVTGAANTKVTWTLQSGVSGEGCSGTACGSIDATGLYTAPTVAPSPNAIEVIATSEADSTKQATAAVAITSGPTIETILPSSVFSGAVESFPLAAHGVNFVAGGGSTASTILINGTPRGTTCATANSCATGLNPTDVQSAAILTIQIQNPGPNGALSNPVPFVIIPFDVSVGILPLTPAQPSAPSILLVVPEPTTAAESAPINVDTIGLLTGGDNCGIQGSPLTVTRPSSGSAIVSLCIHGNGLDPTFSYSFSGAGGAPEGIDIGVTASPITGLFPNLIELDLQISNTTLPGVRTLFITTLNNDRAAATGMLEVK
jgi:hypothetical protein